MRERSPISTGRGHRLWVGILIVASAAGCTPLSEYVHNGFKVGPNYARPTAPIAADWIDASDQRIRKDPDEHRRWWTVFNDPRLDDLICFAVGQNLTLRQAGFRVMAARAQLGIAVGEIFPQHQAIDASFTQRALSTEVANRQFIAQSYYPQWNYGAGLAWELDFWGRYRRAIESAGDTLDASIEQYDDALVTLLGDVADSYILMRYFETQAELAREVAKFQRLSLTLAQARFKAGTASELDVDQAQSDLSKTESEVPFFERFARVENNRLCTLLGIAPEDLEKRLGPGPIPVAPVDVVVGVPADLLRRRPDVRAAERQAASACARIGVAESELYPHISIVGNFGWSALNFGDLFTNTAFAAAVGPVVQWNVLNYGRLVNNIRLKDAEFQQAIANYQNVVVKAGAEVETGLVMFLKGQQRAKELTTAVEAAEKAAKIAQVQYKAGTVDFNRVSLLQERWLLRQLELAGAKQEIARGLVMTYRALGGGWQVRLDGCTPGHAGAGLNMPVDGTSPPTLPTPKPASGKDATEARKDAATPAK